MKVVKYYCDICKKEVESEKDFVRVPYISKSWNYYNNDDEEILEKEICINCLESMSEYLGQHSGNLGYSIAEMKEWIF